MKKNVKCLLTPMANLYRKFVRRSFTWQVDEIKKTIGDNCYHSVSRRVPYYSGDKIRILFVFQVASFWPAEECLYLHLLSDDRYEVKLVCYDDDFDKSIKTETARAYLEQNRYDYNYWKEFDIEDFNPHVVVLQTAYDSNRKAPYTSAALNANGRRVVYIPYGIEIADTLHARKDHFRQPVIENAWRVYTFSEVMRREYMLHLRKRVCVQALGLPRFDALYHSERFLPDEAILQKANGRRIILWKVHFPKVIKEYDKTILVTPDIQQYLDFANLIQKYNDFFFIFMPHPRFKEFNDDKRVREQTIHLMNILSQKENVYIDDQDDYRKTLLMSDAIIVDRSAVMIEAAAVGVPILYMYNETYDEPMTGAVKPLVDSYYHGADCQAMVSFVEQMKRYEDPKRAERESAFHQCIPYYDGQCSRRIADDIANSIMEEPSCFDLHDRIAALEKQATQILEHQRLLDQILDVRKNDKTNDC